MIDITITKKSRKTYRCSQCTNYIRKGIMCINAFGVDYDNFLVIEHVHADPKCFLDWFDNIELVEYTDYPELVEVVAMKNFVRMCI